MNEYKESTPSLIKLLDQNFYSYARSQPTVVLFYDSESQYHPRLKRMYENLSKLCYVEAPNVCFGAIDFNMYPETVLNFTSVLPTLYLFLYGVPILYNGSFNLGDLRLWLKLQVQTCPVIPMPTPRPMPTPSPTNTPSPTPRIF